MTWWPQLSVAAWAPIDAVQAAGNAVEGPQLRRRQMRAMALDMARAVDAHDVGHAQRSAGSISTIAAQCLSRSSGLMVAVTTWRDRW